MAARNFEKVKTIVQESKQWTTFIAPPEIQPEDNIDDGSAEEPAQTVYIVSSLKEAVLKEADSKELKKKRLPGEPAGWLFRHTELQAIQIFPIQPGNNFVGRKKQAALQPFIVVEGDDFISRVQCVLFAEEEGDSIEFFISDPSAFNNGKTSKNGTYINGSNTPVTQKIRLADGDTIQTGITKFVLRFNTGIGADLIGKQVEKSKYMATVVLDPS